jgi:dTDP-4-dehydrorhamnose 3,5-epimerase-like enzyme
VCEVKNEIQIINGGLAADDRGELSFVNDFQFQDVKRFYLVSNHAAGFVRAWHAHRHEAKYVTVVSGAALIGAIRIDNWENPSKDLFVHRNVLSAHKPQVIFIPAGFANGFMSLTADAKILFFSTASLEESRDDDIRYDARYWDIWNIVER